MFTERQCSINHKYALLLTSITLIIRAVHRTQQCKHVERREHPIFRTPIRMKSIRVQSDLNRVVLNNHSVRHNSPYTF